MPFLRASVPECEGHGRAKVDADTEALLPQSSRLDSSAETLSLCRAVRYLVVGTLVSAAIGIAWWSHRAFAGQTRAGHASVGFVGLDEEGDVPKSPTRSSFIEHSRPYMGTNGTKLGRRNEGKLLINEDGVWNQYYLPGANVLHGGKTVEYRPPYRFYLMKSSTTDYSNADNFYKVKLPGKTFTVDMDLNGASCGCNLNFYLVDMPVSFAGKDKDYYCDAQCFSGMGCCAEFDMNEGNANVQQITNHACTHNYGGHPDWQCNKWGDPEDKSSQGQFSMGPGHTIDSRKTFTFSQDFRMEGGQLRVITTMSQAGKSVSMSMGPNEQLQAMLHDGSLERGMAFVTGYWYAPDMNWLDGDECGSGVEHCNKNPAYISNWRITTNGSPQPTPTPEPSPAPAPPSGQCPGTGQCGCSWTEKWGCSADMDDGSECICRCCCEKWNGSCRWSS